MPIPIPLLVSACILTGLAAGAFFRAGQYDRDAVTLMDDAGATIAVMLGAIFAGAALALAFVAGAM